VRSPSSVAGSSRSAPFACCSRGSAASAGPCGPVAALALARVEARSASHAPPLAAPPCQRATPGACGSPGSTRRCAGAPCRIGSESPADQWVGAQHVDGWAVGPVPLLRRSRGGAGAHTHRLPRCRASAGPALGLAQLRRPASRKCAIGSERQSSEADILASGAPER
jgi:hypothetical protein